MNTKAILSVAVVVVLIGGGYVLVKGKDRYDRRGVSVVEPNVRTDTAKQLKPSVQTKTVAPAITPQQFSNTSENGAFYLPRNPVVTTTEGKEITLKLLMEMPPADRGIYSYGNELYAYAMKSGTFTHIANGDATTFEVVPGSFSFELYAKDKSQVYCKGEVLVGADVATFKEIPDWFDALNSGSKKYLVPDRGSYTNYLFFQDKNNQYVYGECAPYKK